MKALIGSFAILLLSPIAVSAQDDTARLAAAEDAYQKRDYDEVLRQVAPFLERDPARDEFAVAARQYAAQALHRRGEEHFRNARIAESLADFDQELELVPETEPRHWQRGISHYYAGEYQKGVRQFDRHQTVNPQDVENAVWHFLCAVRAPDGTVEQARDDLIPIERDRRVPMKQVHQLFAGTTTPQAVLAAAEESGEDGAKFYADLYVGLYYEAAGEADKSLPLVTRAAENPSAQQHYMGDVARVHVKLRKSENHE